MYGFTLDQQVGEFVLSHENIKIPESGKIYSFNEGNYAMWAPGLKKYMDSLKVRRSADFGVMTADSRSHNADWRCQERRQALQCALHRLPGGRLPPHHALRRHLRCAKSAERSHTSSHVMRPLCSGYPGDAKNVNGKLRLLYECAPMSFIAEQAGGKGVDGKGRVLDIQPDKVHQRVPLFVGSKGEVDYLMSFMK